MSLLSFRERMALRRVVSEGIRNGQLPAEAAIVLYHSDAFAELQNRVMSRFAAAGGSHPILAWIAANWQTILQDVLAILPLFGINVPPITLPPTTPPKPSPTVPAGAALEEVAIPRPESAAVPQWPFQEESQVASILFEAIRTTRDVITAVAEEKDCAALREESIACCRKGVKALDALIDSLQVGA